MTADPTTAKKTTPTVFQQVYIQHINAILHTHTYMLITAQSNYILANLDTFLITIADTF